MNFDDYDALLPSERFSSFLQDALHERRGTYQENLNSLARALNYQRPHMVAQWVRGTTKVPIHELLPISRHLNYDLSSTLPLWLSAEAAECDDGTIYLAAKRMLSAWEYGLIHVARDIYGIGEPDDDTGFDEPETQEAE